MTKNLTVNKAYFNKYKQLLDSLIELFNQFGCNYNYMNKKIEKLQFNLKLISIDSIKLILLYYKLFDLVSK